MAEESPLLASSQGAASYGAYRDAENGGSAFKNEDGALTSKGHADGNNGTSANAQQHAAEEPFKPLAARAWSFQEGRRSTATATNKKNDLPIPGSPRTPSRSPSLLGEASKSDRNVGSQKFLYYIVYALVNVIISAPGLYGYAAVIFNNPVFENHMNALSKLVLFSSLVHQLGFLLFSSLDFAIGTVQDAGLIFLSHMANTIANIMLDDGHTEAEIVSTTLVLLSLGTASLGLVLVVMGKFRLADAVSYLPMPVVGGYLAFIGYFCIQAGVALCISQPLIAFSDWKYVLEPNNLLLAAPGLIAGLILTFTSRRATNSAVLPGVMVAIPLLFYIGIYATGIGLEGAREGGWVGPEAPSVPVGDLFRLVDFSLVRWDLWPEIFSTWVGMVFVVSFASCLDVAAISMDMGEALDTNRELTTVGICNFMSGLTFGFTGSYIFSQTIFTYRTGCHSRWIGFMIMIVFAYIVCSPVNVLEVSPLFFLGSTLIFIGYDLLYEWLWEIRHQVFLSEYGIVWFTFIIIQVVGIDAGIILGVCIAILDQVVVSAKTSSINRVSKTSRAVWTPADAKILHDHAYNPVGPKIVTLEVIGTIFFGSSLNILTRMNDEIGLGEDEQVFVSPIQTPHTSSHLLTLDRKSSSVVGDKRRSSQRRVPPKYLVLDLMAVSHLDASATRGCFLQLVKMCAKRDILVCASGMTPRIEWMFRSHGVSISTEEEEDAVRARLLSRQNYHRPSSLESILLFVTVQEALEFCETALIHRFDLRKSSPSLARISDVTQQSLARVLIHIIGASEEEKETLWRLDNDRYHEEKAFNSGDMIFQKNTHADSFYIVLQGSIANATSSTTASDRQNQPVVSGAGLIQNQRTSSSNNLFDVGFQERSDKTTTSVATLWHAGSVFGYLDYLLERPRQFRTLVALDGTKVAKFTHSNMNLLQAEDPILYGMIQRVILHASTLDLMNCTCNEG